MNLLQLIVFLSGLFAQGQPPPQEIKDGDKPVKIEKIVTEGSRFQLRSILAISGLRTGQQVTEVAVRKAIQKIVNSGLIDNVDYTYESLSETDSVILTLKLRDTVRCCPPPSKFPGWMPKTPGNTCKTLIRYLPGNYLAPKTRLGFIQTNWNGI